MPELRSRTTTHGRNMAGARALWRATGMGEGDFGKPIVAIANSFTQFVPGHVHLKDMGALVAGAVAEAGGVGREFNTIAVDDGIAPQVDGGDILVRAVPDPDPAEEAPCAPGCPPTRPCPSPRRGGGRSWRDGPGPRPPSLKPSPGSRFPTSCQ